MSGLTPYDRNLPETITTWFLQVLGATSAVIFGVYGALSWQNSNDAKRQADMSNMVAVVALCAQLKETGSDSPTFLMFCKGVQRQAEKSVRSLATALLGEITPVAEASPSPTMSGNSTTTLTSRTTGAPTPTISAPTHASQGGGLDDKAKLALGLGLGIGFSVLVISGLAAWGWWLRTKNANSKAREA